MSSYSLSRSHRLESLSFLIVGGDGLLGSGLTQWLLSQKFQVNATSRRIPKGPNYLNLASNLNLSEFEDHDPDVVVLAAGISSVDECAENPESTRVVNVERQLELAAYWYSRGKKVVAFSSTHVFSDLGELSMPTSHPLPVTEYGRQKIALEEGLARAVPTALVLRVTKIVSREWQRALIWTSALQHGRVVEALEDLRFAPIHVDALAATMFELCLAGRQGIVHLSPEDSVSYAEFALLIATKLGVDPHLVVCRGSSSSTSLFAPYQLGIPKSDRQLPANRAHSKDTCVKVIDEILGR